MEAQKKHTSQLICLLVILALVIWPLSTSAAPAANSKSATNLQQKLKEKEQKVKELKAQQDKLRKKLQEITQQYQEAYTKLILIKEKVQRNKQKLDEASIELDLNKEKLDSRIVAMYKNRQELLVLNLLLNFTSFDEFLSQIQYMVMVAKADASLVSETSALKEQVKNKQAVLEQEKAKQQQALDEVQKKQNDMKRNLDAQHMLEKLLAQDIEQLKKQTTNIDGLELSIIFPVNGPHSFINDWGFPRSGGRRHRGNDIFASQSTPLVAVTDGVIGAAQTVERGLGGITLWLYGDDNVQYYYAHLEKIETGIAVGTRVAAGQVIGYVGNTGNARTTPPHVHFQVHPGGGEPINPYPFLVAADPYK